MPLLCLSCLEKFLLLFEQADALRVCVRERGLVPCIRRMALLLTGSFSKVGGKGWDVGLGEVGPVFPGRDVERGRGPGRR